MSTSKRLSELDSVLSVTNSDEMLLNQSGVSKKVTVETLKGAFGSSYLSGTANPTAATVAAAVGQNYVNTVTGNEFVCTAISGSTYTWKLISTTVKVNNSALTPDPNGAVNVPVNTDTLVNGSNTFVIDCGTSSL